jgi:SAM-dependent methyltransferase
MKLLFLGCGNGTEVKRTLEMGHDSWGVTLNPNNSVWAREELGLWNVYYHDAHLNPVEWNGSFDGVLGFQFLEHTPSPILLLMEVERILRPGGITYFETPGPEGFTGGSNLHHVTCPTRTQAHGWMLKVGFTDIQVEEIGPPDAARHLSIFGRKT